MNELVCCGGKRITTSTVPAVKGEDGIFLVNSTLTITNVMRGDAGDDNLCTAQNWHFFSPSYSLAVNCEIF